MDYKGTTANANPVNDIQTKISSLTRPKDNIFLKPKDDRTYGGGGWMTVGGWIQGAKAVRKGTSQDGGSNGTTWGRYHQGKRRNANRGVGETRGAKRKCMAKENIISAVIRRRDNAHLHRDFVPLTKRGIYRRKT